MVGAAGLADGAIRRCGRADPDLRRRPWRNRTIITTFIASAHPC